MKGVAIFIGGPLDEQRIVLPDLTPEYLCPVKDRVYSLEETDMAKSASFGILRYKRTRLANYDGRAHAIYEVDL